VTVERYTAHPRPVLWLVPEGEIDGVAVEPFYLSSLPVTNRQLDAFAPERPRPPAAPGDDDPAVGVDVDLARGYCEWYARISRKAIRLPTVVEWRYACRGGGEALCGWGTDESAADPWLWHRGNSGDRVPSLGAKRSNGFGLYAMLGGVWEWALDASGPQLCGGSWRTPLAEISCGARRRLAPGEPLDDVGFRIARSLRG
jgi:formylglycine-generating enzyme required for sulfatase activity